MIPAYEPDEKLLELVIKLKESAFEIVIVDDGSGQEFQEVFEHCKQYTRVISYPDNKEKGAALKTGFQNIIGNYQEPYTVVTVDADGQHKVFDVCRVCCEAETNPDVLILGSRKLGKNVPLRSKLGNSITRRIYMISSGVRIYDTQTGLRAFTDGLLPALLKIPGERYEYEMNVLMHFAKEGRSMKEIQIETIYLENNKSSHFDARKDSWRIYREIIKFSASSLISFGIDYALYCMLTAVCGSYIAANIAARLVSACINFTMNRNMVFKSNIPLAKTIPQYALLAILILSCNTSILFLLARLGLNKYAAKILTEIMMFMASWFIQHSVIFRKKANDGRFGSYEKV